MARSFRTNPVRRQTERRKTDWIGGISTGLTVPFTISAATSAIVASVDTRVASAGADAPWTITRIRGILQIRPLGNASGSDPFGAFGVCIVNGEAFDAGIASIITPWTESFDDRWMYHTYWACNQTNGNLGTDSFWGFAMGMNVEIDSKAMRKMETGDVLVWVIENASAADAAQFITNSRTLVKLH